MKKLHFILSILAVIIGVVHVFFAMTIYDSLDFNALWFLSGGLFLIVLSFLNLIMNRRQSITPMENRLWVVSNFLTLIFIGLTLYVMWDIGTIIISAIVSGMVLTSFMLVRR